MASLTVRQLDEKLKTAAAPARGAARPLDGGRGPRHPARRRRRRPAATCSSASSRRRGRARQKRAAGAPRRAARPAHHRRRHCRLQVARSHPPPAGSRRAACAASSPPPRSISSRRSPPARSAGERAYTDLFDPQSEFDVGHIRLARDTDLDRGRAGDRRSDRQNGGRPCRRSRHRRAARDRQADPDRAGDESAHVGGQGDAAQSRATDGRRRPRRRPERRRNGRARRSRHRPHGRAAGNRRRRRGDAAQRRSARRQARAGHLGADQRADRSGALHRQPLVGQAGSRHRRRGGRGRRRGGAGFTVRSICPIRPAFRWCRSRPRSEMLAAVEKALPADVAVFAAAVADWRAAAGERQQDQETAGPDRRRSSWSRTRTFSSTIAHRKSGRPRLVIGFAAETEDVVANAKAKLEKKGCDWILANDVSPATGIMGGDSNTIHLVTRRRRRILAAAIEGRRRARAGRADRSGACGSQTMSGDGGVEVRIMRLPHGADLPLPQYHSALAAGLDLLAAVPADAPVELAPGARGADSERLRDGVAARPRRARSGRARALRSATA